MSIAWLWVLVLVICAVLVSWQPKASAASVFFAVWAALIAAHLMGYGLK